jgi:hypothetical protein
MPLRPCDVEESFQRLKHRGQSFMYDVAPNAASFLWPSPELPFSPREFSPLTPSSPASRAFQAPADSWTVLREQEKDRISAWKGKEIDLPSVSTVDLGSSSSSRSVGYELQACSFTVETKQRSVFRTAHFHVTGEYLNRSVSLHFEDGSSETIRLLGTRVNFGDLTGTPEDVQPSFVENSICIQESDATSGWFLACRTRQDLNTLADNLCFAGCIMRDLAQNCCIARDTTNQLKLDSNGYTLIPARPKTSRITTHADVVVLKVAMRDEGKRTKLLNEVQFLLALSHDGIPHAYGIYDMKLKGERALAMLTDVPMTGTPLSAWIPAGGLPEPAVKDLMAQLCDVLVYLQSVLVVHRNIKPENVICEVAHDSGVRVVLGDFGVAAIAGGGSNEQTKLAVPCGSPGFIAPELFDDRNAGAPAELTAEGALTSTKIDVFSFGLLLSTVLVGTNPFQGETQAATYRNNAELNYNPGMHFGGVNTVSDALRSLLSSICAPDPRQRCLATEASSHPWFFQGRMRITHADLHQIKYGRKGGSARPLRGQAHV